MSSKHAPTQRPHHAAATRTVRRSRARHWSATQSCLSGPQFPQAAPPPAQSRGPARKTRSHQHHNAYPRLSNLHVPVGQAAGPSAETKHWLPRRFRLPDIPPGGVPPPAHYPVSLAPQSRYVVSARSPQHSICSAGVSPAVPDGILPSGGGRDARRTAAGTAALRNSTPAL